MLGIDARPPVTAERRIRPSSATASRLMSMGFFLDEQVAGHLARADRHGDRAAVPARRRLGRRSSSSSSTCRRDGRRAAHARAAGAGRAAASIVTTPQDVALLDVARGMAMFAQVSTPVPRRGREHERLSCAPAAAPRTPVFGAGGGRGAGRRASACRCWPGIPIDRRACARRGSRAPIVVAEPDAPVSQTLRGSSPTGRAPPCRRSAVAARRPSRLTRRVAVVTATGRPL